MATNDSGQSSGDKPQSSNEPDVGRIGAATGKVKQTASEAYETARQRTSSLYGNAREGVTRAGQRTGEQVDANPMAAVVGGLAIGAVVAALLPRTQREAAVLGGVGSRINDSARQAARAARDAGRDKLDELGLNREGARQRLNELASTAGDALRTSATAAAKSVRGEGEG